MEYCGQDSKTDLEKYYCYEAVDRVSRDAETTRFKRRARLNQALWREAHSFPAGTQPMRPRPGRDSRPLGSRIDLDFAHATGANFLTEAARNAAHLRVTNSEPKQTLNVDRLYSDLLSSMPMCFNLFGSLSEDLSFAEKVLKAWWPNTPGTVRAVRFEWSPGRQLQGRYLENRSAFDVAFELQLEDGGLGLVGLETKYHEDCRPESVPSEWRLRRYKKVTEDSGVFQAGAMDAIIGERLQQIWLDHLLALSMLQDKICPWKWVKFLVVYPSDNVSFARATEDYSKLLVNDSTFGAVTIESLLENTMFSKEDVFSFRERYFW
ncbi:MAG: hypothetical protein V1800_14305 [Candidatus Latescibacterota bacterium]